jgi:hypothetical protein
MAGDFMALNLAILDQRGKPNHAMRVRADRADLCKEQHSGEQHGWKLLRTGYEKPIDSHGIRTNLKSFKKTTLPKNVRAPKTETSERADAIHISWTLISVA